MVNKKALRLLYKDKRSALPCTWIDEYGPWICKQMLNLPQYKKSKRIMAYLGMGKEVCLDEFIRAALRDGKEIYVPVCTNERGIMKSVRLFDLDEIVQGEFNIRIPKEPHSFIEAKSLDLIFVPGLAFDKIGRRLGMGGGYYDRFLPPIPKVKRIGIAWSLQISAEAIPIDEHDQLMGSLITEKEIIACKSC